MKYKLFNKKKGVNPKLFFEFELDEKIIDFSSNLTNDIFFITNNFLFAKKNDANFIDKICNFNFATSIDFNPVLNTIYISENGGRKIHMILDDIRYDFFSETEEEFMKKSLAKYKNDIHSKIKADGNGDLYILIKDANKIFIKKQMSCTLECLIGTGYAEYRQSNNVSCCSLNFPNSIDLLNKKLYIADKGNNVIRMYNNNSLKTIVGNPLKNDILPEQVVATNNILYFCNENLYATNIHNPSYNGIAIHKSENNFIIAKNQTEEDSIYILEFYDN